MTQATLASIEEMLLNFIDHHQQRTSVIMSAIDDLKASIEANTAIQTKVAADVGAYLAATADEKAAIARAVADQKAADEALIAALTGTVTANNQQFAAISATLEGAMPAPAPAAPVSSPAV
jgi:hypothetical protein